MVNSYEGGKIGYILVHFITWQSSYIACMVSECIVSIIERAVVIYTTIITITITIIITITITTTITTTITISNCNYILISFDESSQNNFRFFSSWLSIDGDISMNSLPGFPL